MGAGTGKLTQDLIDIKLSGIAIEPNTSMRTEGVKNLSNTPFTWIEGTAEMTTLPDSSVDLILMGSSFHWTDQLVALKEFHRILRPKGFFTAIWNPRDIRLLSKLSF